MRRIIDKEFLQYIKDTGYDDLLDIDEKDIPKVKNTYSYLFWQLENSYKDLAKAMRETKIGSAIIWVAEFLNKCIMLDFRKRKK